MDINQIVALVPDYQQFFSVQEMAQRTELLCMEYPGIVRRTLLGNSRFGAPIELVSIGDGAHSVMVVGAPHPHELVGTLMADYLLQLFCQRPELLQSTGASWHFIKAIDPDGVALNAGWLSEPLLASNYFSSFFRPPLYRQAEYTFPFSSGDVEFSEASPENQAWKNALDLVEPDLLYSTHNCEFGGVFFFTSDGLPDLDQTLSELPVSYQFQPDFNGEHGSIPKPGSPGVFNFPDEIAESIREMGMQGSNGKLMTGDSSAGYAQQRFATFSLIAEVPYWCAKPHHVQYSIIADIIHQTREWYVQGEQLLMQFLPLLQTANSPGALLLLEALALPTMSSAEMTYADTAETPLNWMTAVTNQLLVLRRPAMLFKLSEIAFTFEQRTETQHAYEQMKQTMHAWMMALEKSDMLERVPLRKLVQLQTEAGLLTLQHLIQARIDSVI